MFKKYMHIERYGSDEVKGITKGKCFIFHKLDGTNASVWEEDGEILAGSRNRQLTLDRDNQGFYAWVKQHEEEFLDFFEEHPNWRLYGEWLVPHTLKNYKQDAWEHFYVFDTYSHEREEYISFKEYSDALKSVECVKIIPPITIVENPNKQMLLKLSKQADYLVEEGIGEGIVIKRYDFLNAWGDRIWAKIVRDDFREMHKSNFTPKDSLEAHLAEKYVTRGRIKKILAKMRESSALRRKRIPELFGRVWHDIITEEAWEIIKDNNKPILDFNDFYHEVIICIKENCPELF